MKSAIKLKISISLFKKLIVIVSIGTLCIITAALFISVIKSAYFYTLDNDEFHQSQVIYLLHYGYKPFTQIYLTVYPPIFHYVMMPFYALKGFTFSTIEQARGVMIALFTVRTLLGAGMLSVLVSPLAGLLFLPLALLHPFTVYSEMQIRPDNLMVAFYVLGLFLATLAHKRNAEKLYFFSSFFVSLSVLTLMKILPSALAFYVISIIFFIIQKRWKSVGSTLLGIGIAWCVFSIPLILQGTFREMINQVFVESISSYSGVFQYPVPLGFYMRQDNSFIYGLGGKPVNWMWVWIIPLLGFAGLYQLFTKSFDKKVSWKAPIFLILFFSLVGQWGFLFFLESVFVQHYTSINWLLAVGAAVVFSHVLEEIHPKSLLSIFFWIASVGIFVYFIKGSIPANESHASIQSTDLQARYERAWNVLPENEPVFPNMLFRPLAYPVPHNHFIGNIPDGIYYRLPSIIDSLEKQKTKYIYIDEYYLQHLKPNVQYYITTHYDKSSLNENLYLRHGE